VPYPSCGKHEMTIQLKTGKLVSAPLKYGEVSVLLGLIVNSVQE
jgi:hypothetical protein